MPRSLTLDQALRKLTSLKLYRIAGGTFGDTTLSSSVAKGAATIPVTATTNFTAADPCFVIGDGGMELISAIGTPNVSMPITNQKVEFAQAAGARFVEAVAVALGKIAKGTAKFSASKSLNAIFSDVDDGAIGYLDGPIELSMGFGLYDFTILALQLALGLVDNESGAGTTADPYQGGIGGPDQLFQTYQAIRALGLLHNGKTFEIDFLGARFEISGDVNLDGRDAPAVVAVSVKAPQLIWRVRP